MASIASFRVTGDLPPWTVTSVSKFVVGALARVEGATGPLPARFFLSVCPWGERNAMGGTPPQVLEVVDPRMRLVHFTGCGRPYLIVLFTGANAAERQQRAIETLPWSEHFEVANEQGAAALTLIACTEDVANGVDDWSPQRTLQGLLETGELGRF
jgi:hypothetical protein